MSYQFLVVDRSATTRALVKRAVRVTGLSSAVVYDAADGREALELLANHRVDLALIPVGGWGPSLGDGHLDPAGAAEAMRRANPREAIPIHYGTFWPVGCARVRPDLFTAPGRTFARLAAQSAPTTLVRVLAPGDGVGVGRSRSAP